MTDLILGACVLVPPLLVLALWLLLPTRADREREAKHEAFVRSMQGWR